MSDFTSQARKSLKPRIGEALVARRANIRAPVMPRRFRAALPAAGPGVDATHAIDSTDKQRSDERSRDGDKPAHTVGSFTSPPSASSPHGVNCASVLNTMCPDAAAASLNIRWIGNRS